MYRIISVSDGSEIGVVDAVTYIKISNSGSYTNATKEDATGVAVNSTPYNLMGHEDIGGEDTVVVSEFDGGALVAEQQRIINGLLISSLEG